MGRCHAVCATVLIGLMMEYVRSDIGLFDSLSSHNGKRPANGYIERQETATSLQCARKCKRKQGCVSAFYTPDDGDCQLHSTAVDMNGYVGATEDVVSTEYMYFAQTLEAKAATTTTPTTTTNAPTTTTTTTSAPTSTTAASNPPTTTTKAPTTTTNAPTTTTNAPTTTTNAPTTTTNAPTTTTTQPYEFACNDIFSAWTLAKPTSGPDFYVRIFDLQDRAQPDAKVFCSDQGFRLPKIVTVEKLEFYRTVILQCSGVNGNGYWVDGVNTLSGDWTWTTDDLTPIPMLQGVGGLWASGRPNGGNNPNCIWMSDYGTFDYRFDDLTCDTTFSEIYTICESDTGGV